MPGACVWGALPARYGGTGREARVSALSLGLADHVGQFGLDVDEVGLLAAGHDRVGALEEVRDLLDRRLEVGLAEGRGQFDVQHVAWHPVRGPGRRPDHDIAEALTALDAAGQ